MRLSWTPASPSSRSNSRKPALCDAGTLIVGLSVVSPTSSEVRVVAPLDGRNFTCTASVRRRLPAPQRGPSACGALPRFSAERSVRFYYPSLQNRAVFEAPRAAPLLTDPLLARPQQLQRHGAQRQRQVSRVPKETRQYQ